MRLASIPRKTWVVNLAAIHEPTYLAFLCDYVVVAVPGTELQMGVSAAFHHLPSRRERFGTLPFNVSRTVLQQAFRFQLC